MDKKSSAARDDHWKSRSDMDDRQTLKELRVRADNGETDLRPLIEGLELLHSLYFKVFHEVDGKAIRYQWWYRALALASTLTGGVAVLVAIYQLATGEHQPVASGLQPPTGGQLDMAAVVEFIFAFLSLLIVVVVILMEIKQKWLLKRVQAERLRLGKFEALLDGSLWSTSGRQLLQSRLERDIGLMQFEDEDKIEEWARNHPIPKDRSAPDGTRRALAEELRTYYHRTRLSTQLEYLNKQYPVERKRNRCGKPWGPLLFYASVIAAVGHSLLNYGSDNPKEGWLTTLIALAVGLPALAAFVRIHRDTREYGRNSLRHHATYNALRELSHQLTEEKSPDGIFRIVGLCEQILESDTREWTRLFSESEWFG